MTPVCSCTILFILFELQIIKTLSPKIELRYQLLICLLNNMDKFCGRFFFTDTLFQSSRRDTFFFVYRCRTIWQTAKVKQLVILAGRHDVRLTGLMVSLCPWSLVEDSVLPHSYRTLQKNNNAKNKRYYSI